jgi:hypothetical protein
MIKVVMVSCLETAEAGIGDNTALYGQSAAHYTADAAKGGLPRI